MYSDLPFSYYVVIFSKVLGDDCKDIWLEMLPEIGRPTLKYVINAYYENGEL